MTLTCYRDRTYCASPNCKNECGRKMSKEVEELLKKDEYGRTSYAYFCGEPESIPIDTSHQVFSKDINKELHND